MWDPRVPVRRQPPPGGIYIIDYISPLFHKSPWSSGRMFDYDVRAMVLRLADQKIAVSITAGD